MNSTSQLVDGVITLKDVKEEKYARQQRSSIARAPNESESATAIVEIKALIVARRL